MFDQAADVTMIDERVADACQLPQALIDAEEAVRNARRAVVAASEHRRATILAYHGDNVQPDHKARLTAKLAEIDSRHEDAAKRLVAARSLFDQARAAYEPQFVAQVESVEREIVGRARALLDQLEAQIRILGEIAQHAQANGLNVPSVTRGSPHAALHVQRIRLWLSGRA